MKITYTLKKSQQKQALFQPDKWILQLTSTSWRFKDVEIKGGAQKAEKIHHGAMYAFPKSLSTICSIQKIN